MVDPETGRRFVNELADRKIRADALLALGRPGVAIVDQANADAAGVTFERALEKGVVKKFEDFNGLVKHYQLPPTVFQTLENYNRGVAAKKDPEWGKPILDRAGPLVRPPFYAMRVWPKIHHTMGGIGIDDRTRVLDISGQPIPGLQAAGEVTGGVHGACRLGSCAITECLVLGRRAGREAAGTYVMKNPWRLICLLLPVTLALIACGGGQGNGSSPLYQDVAGQVTEYIEEQMVRERVTGLSLALVDGQSLIWAGGFGLADAENRKSVDRDTVFEIGSLSKNHHRGHDHAPGRTRAYEPGRPSGRSCPGVEHYATVRGFRADNHTNPSDPSCRHTRRYIARRFQPRVRSGRLQRLVDE